MAPALLSRKPKNNPYSQRGLDQFALVSAELQAARDTLVAQLGTQLSLVRFTSAADQGTWIPIIVAPTSSKAESHALRRAASDLFAGGKLEDFEHHSIPVTGSLLKHLGSSIGEYSTDEGIGIRKKNPADNSSSNLCSTTSKISNESSSIDTKNDVGTNPIRVHDKQEGILGYLMVVTQRFLWMLNITAFGLSIIVDIARMAILSDLHTDGDKNQVIVHPCQDMASSSHVSAQAQPTSTARRHIKGMNSLPPLHVEAPRTYTISKDHRVSSTCPSSPLESRQLSKSLAASVSLPRTDHVQGHTLHGDNKEKKQAQKTNQNKAVRSYASMVDATARKMSSAVLGQTLSGAGLVLVLGGLLMGYIPAIVSIVCWWYVLPSMRKAIGDMPVVRNHHHHHHHHGSQENKGNVGGNSDMQYQEYKKKVIMDGLLDRRRPHSNA